MTSDTVVMRKTPSVFAYLIVVKGSHVGRVFHVNADVTTVGRSASSNVRIDDANVSDQHAKIRSAGPGSPFVVHDLATTNGTKVNGQAIAQHELSSNDLLQFGDAVLVFKELKTGV